MGQGGAGNYKPIPAPNSIQVSQNYLIPVPYPINLFHTHPNKGRAGQVTLLTREITIPRWRDVEKAVQNNDYRSGNQPT